MEYPGTRFTFAFRRAFLLALIALFFVVSPIIIAYTAGYRYDFKNGFLKQTGAISVDVEPKNAALYLNGIKIKSKMPVRLNNIAPAKYSLRITAPGYADWNKEIEVFNKLTVYIKEISLLKKNARPLLAAPGQIAALALSSDGRYILFASSADGKIWLLNTKTEALASVTTMPKTLPSLAWAKEKNCASVTGNDVVYAFCLPAGRQAPDNPGKIYNLTKIAGVKIIKTQWGDGSRPSLYYQTRDGLFAFSPANGRAQKISERDFYDWYMDNGQLWTLTFATSSHNLLVKKDALGFQSEIGQLENTEDWRLLYAERDSALLKKNNASEMMLVTRDKKFAFAGDKFYISPYNNWWLMWTPWELWTYSAGEEPYLLNRSGENLMNVFPLDKHNTLALVWKNKITALFPYYYVTHELADGNAAVAAADPGQKALYYVDKIGNVEGLWRLEY